MKTYSIIRKAFATIAFFCLMTAPVCGNAYGAPVSKRPVATKTTEKKNNQGKTMKNTFAVPDFAYPETVMKNARAEYAKSLKAGDGQRALQGAIQLSVASSLVNSEGNVNENIARFDTLANTLPAPWNAMSLIAQAQLYNSIYQSNQWDFNQRKLPLDRFPDNVLAWSKDMFAIRTQQCVERAADMAGAGNYGIADVAGVLKNTKDAIAAKMTVSDFVRFAGAQALDVYADRIEPLRFGDITELTEAQKCGELQQKLLRAGENINKEKGNIELASEFAYRVWQNIENREQKQNWLDRCYKEYGNTAYGAYFVGAYLRNLTRIDEDRIDEDKEDGNAIRNKRSREALEIATRYNNAFPTARGNGEVRSFIETLTSQVVNLNYPQAVIPGEEWKCKVTGMNVYDFYIMVYKFPDSLTDNNINYDTFRTKGQLITTVPVKLAGTAPDMSTAEVKMPLMKAGNYALFASTTGKETGIIRNSQKDVSGSRVLVSDISYFEETDINDNVKRLYVVDARTQQPVQGAKVTWTKTTYRGASETRHFTTDSNGCVVLPLENGKVFVRKGDSFCDLSYWMYGRGNSEVKEQPFGTVLTDLSIYKPGDTVRFVAVAGVRKGNDMKESGGKAMEVVLRDANYQPVDTVRGTTDTYGRLTGEFRLPTDGLLGSYAIQLVTGDRVVAATNVQVADYKTPTFKVETGKVAENFELGDVLKIEGDARTYSGMPVAGAKVAYTVTYSPWRWWWGMSESNQSCTGTTTTDGDGKFVIELPTETLKGTPYAKGLFTLKVDVTDAAGETRQAPATMFSMAAAYTIDANVPERFKSEPDAKFGTVTVRDMTGKPVDRKIYYTIADSKGTAVEQGEFAPGAFVPGTNAIIPGKYKITFSLSEDMRDTDECPNHSTTVIVWSADEKKPPVETALWVPEYTYYMAEGEKTLSVPVGSSYKNSYIYCVVNDGEKTLERKWLKVSDGMTSVKVDAPAADRRIFLHFTGMHDLKGEVCNVVVIPPFQQEKVEISTESFRDKLEPGAREQWKFGFKIGGKPMVNRPVMAVMSNQALNAIAPFEWSFNPASMCSWSTASSISMRQIGSWSTDFYKYARLGGKNYGRFVMPELNTYGYGLYDRWGSGMVLYDCVMPQATMGAVNEMKMDAAPVELRSSRSAGVKMKQSARVMTEEAADEELAETEVTEAGAGSAGTEEEVRPVECPLAFFMPELTTDGNGVATLDFDVPQFNGTWQLQIAGYDKYMRGGVKMLTAVATKKVMVQMNAPRFLRTGDKAEVSATLFNNSGETLPLAGRIEILNAEGKVLVAEDFGAEETKASGSRTVTIKYDVPDNLSAVTIRAYAIGGNHRDGEGTDVAVLPSSTPVIESKPFYAGPGEQVIKADIPANAKNANVTLQYCGNPIWECVTALPDIVTPKSDNILSQVAALYGNAIASGLIKQFPQLGEALKTFAAPENAGDSTLVSHLEKDQNLKVTTLNNTPWVNDAKEETMRMQSLIKYTNTKEAEAAVNAIMVKLRDRQNNDGGWSWCDNMPTSEFITARVLLHFAMLKGMGYMPANSMPMLTKAFAYTDKELVKEWERNKRKYISVSQMLNYLYVKSFFPDVKDAGSFGQMRKVAMKEIADGWKDFDIYDKAVAAILEHRSGNKALSGNILESLRQFATVSPEKGMCFENLRGVWSGWNPLITTAQVLEAYTEVQPEAEAVDQLRQWLLMSKQTQSWSDNRATAEVIHALLSSGSDWTVPSENATVTVGGKEIAVPKRAKLTDSFTMTLTPGMVKRGDIKIEKHSAGPAWGGVISQYVAPIEDVKDQSIPQLSIFKNIYTMDGNKAQMADLKTGDKVRVTLTIKCDRDLDYVAVMDSRSACLEPAGQLSGYTSSDGVWYYREVRNEGTNLFIPFLGKGTHVLNYECYVDRAGEYSLGIAQAQSQYAPVITAHSAGMIINVK